MKQTKSLRLDTLEKLSLHKISIGKASKILNTSIFQLLDLLKEKNINWTNYSQEDLEKDPVEFLTSQIKLNTDAVKLTRSARKEFK